MFHHCGPDAAALGEQAHPAAVAGNQGAFGCRKGNIKVAVRVLAMDTQRSGEAEGNLRDAGKVFDIARQRAGVE